MVTMKMHRYKSPEAESIVDFQYCSVCPFGSTVPFRVAMLPTGCFYLMCEHSRTISAGPLVPDANSSDWCLCSSARTKLSWNFTAVSHTSKIYLFPSVFIDVSHKQMQTSENCLYEDYFPCHYILNGQKTNIKFPKATSANRGM
jgi:hypothetical protein